VSDPIAERALAALDGVVSGLLPQPVPAGLTRAVQVRPLTLRTPGLGGFIGTNASPAGSILARRIGASVDLRVDGGSEDVASGYLSELLRSVLARDRGELRRDGIYRVSVDATVSEARRARLNLDYEYRDLPTSSAGLIEAIDLGVISNVTPYRARLRWELATSSLVGAVEPLSDFIVADDPDLDPGSSDSDWQFDEAVARITQQGSAQGGGIGLEDPKKAGAQLLFAPGGAPLELRRFIVSVEFESSDPGGVGVVFARESGAEFVYFLASPDGGYQVFGQKTASGYRLLGQPALGEGFSLNQRHTLDIIVHDQTLLAELDGRRSLDAVADAPVSAGALGLLTHGNAAAHFHRARVIELY
jgi:hypothetical protein